MTTSFCKQTAAAATTAGRFDCARGLRRVTVIETMRENARVIKTIKKQQQVEKKRQKQNVQLSFNFHKCEKYY